MLRLTSRQRDVLIEKVPDVANLGFASLVFGQALSDQPFSLWWALVGLLFWRALFGWILLLASGEST